MSAPPTTELPIPKSWDEFEDMVCEIYKREWQDPHTQRYGRSGQSQNGVDIYGRRNSSDDYSAIQCKRFYKKKLNEQAIRAEVKKAESFSSTISEYLIATTESRDKKIQDFIRTLNKERQQNNTFIVNIVFWEDISTDLAHPDNRDLLKKYYFSDWGRVYASVCEGKEEKDSSIRYLLSLDIQQDCELLQELLDWNDQEYLSEKWKTCLSQNRRVWQDISSRMVLSQSSREVMKRIQDFYKQLDSIEEDCRTLLELKSRVQPTASKPKYRNGILGFGTIHPPAWAEKFLTEVDFMKLTNSKKENRKKLEKLKESVCITLDFASKLVKDLT